MKTKLLFILSGVLFICFVHQVVEEDIEVACSATSSLEAIEIVNTEMELPLELNISKVSGGLSYLQRINDEVIGWIIIPDTPVNYPLMQTTNNEYYLHNTWNNKENSAGSIFMDFRCSSSLTDINTIIYGHRMKNESMFGSLKYYTDESYIQNHPYIYIITKDHVYKYKVATALIVSIESNIYFPTTEFMNLDCTDADSSVQYLTLSTCNVNDYTTRLVVIATLSEVL